jgi:peptide/nickel transport system permease protein
MIVYIVKRALMAFVVVVLLMVFLGVLVHLIPGDPVKIILGQQASPALSEQVRVQMGLDKPVATQVWLFVWHALRGDLGTDFITHVPVLTLIADALPHTVVLAIAGLGLAVVLGVPLGVYAASHANSLGDRVTALLSVSLITMPAYIAGLLLLLAFTVELPLVPSIGTGSFEHPLDYLRHLLLPAVALGSTWIGYIARMVRTSMIEVLNSNYIRTARAYGLKQRTILYKHALKNALIPTVAVLGVGLGHLMGGAVLIENIFSRSGLGQLILGAIATRNYPVIRGGVLAIAVLFVVTNLIADLSYRFLDPRIRVEIGGSGRQGGPG